MAKKKKKKLLPKFIRKLIKPLLFVLVVGSAVVLYKPELIPDEQNREKVSGIRDNATKLASQTSSQLTSNKPKLPQIMTSSEKSLVSIGDKDIYVEDVVSEVGQQLESLPQEQYSKFRAAFCADLVATASATASSQE